MTHIQLPSVANQAESKPIIISYADSNHYLAGYEDTIGNFHSLLCGGKNASFNSIREAEAAFKLKGVNQVTVELQTAYDEMIGNTDSSHCRYKVNL